jgi:hypothetical protein
MKQFRKILNCNRFASSINNSFIGRWAENSDLALVIEDHVSNLYSNLKVGPLYQGLVLCTLSPIILVGSYYYLKKRSGIEYEFEREFLIKTSRANLSD